MAHSEAFLNLVNASKEKIREFTCDEVVARLNKGEELILIDTREDREWEKGRIKGAVHLGKGIIERDIESMFPDKDVELILYCGGGFRSALAAEALQIMGYKHPISMDGGIREWKSKSYPMEE